MIPVQLQPEPLDFDQKVRVKGLAFLINNPNPDSKAWKSRDYWTEAIDDLCKAYSRMCAYSAQWIPPVQGNPTTDHFIPKSIAPDKAYEWNNYRLSSQLLNSRKGDFQDVLDPFTIQPDWFVLDFPSLQVEPGSALDSHTKQKVISTISRLRLNEDSCIQSRESWLIPFCHSKYPFSFLKEKAPFIAYELERQKLVDKIPSIYPAKLDNFF